MSVKRVYTSKDKDKVLQHALKNNFDKISLWKDLKGVWHAAKGPNHVPSYALVVEHIK